MTPPDIDTPSLTGEIVNDNSSGPSCRISSIIQDDLIENDNKFKHKNMTWSRQPTINKKMNEKASVKISVTNSQTTEKSQRTNQNISYVINNQQFLSFGVDQVGPTSGAFFL